MFKRFRFALASALLSSALLGCPASTGEGLDSGPLEPGVDGGEAIGCDEWEARVREMAAQQYEASACVAGLGGGCALELLALTCDDGSSISFCIAVGSLQEPFDLTAACAIARADTCAVLDSCDAKRCWCASAEGFGDERLIINDAESSLGCVEGLYLGDPCTNDGDVCSISPAAACVTDACQNLCVVTNTAACLDGVMRSYVSEFEVCAGAEDCLHACEALEDASICFESPACADDVCASDCVVSVCGATRQDPVRQGVPRTDIIPCD